MENSHKMRLQAVRSGTFSTPEPMGGKGMANPSFPDDSVHLRPYRSPHSQGVLHNASDDGSRSFVLPAFALA